jgi:uncharacterized protein YecT (DUF1311 family)
MRTRFIAGLTLLAYCLFAHSPLFARETTPEAQKLVADCKTQSADSVLIYERCLQSEYKKLEKQTERLTDKLDGLVGGHKSFGRWKIRDWSSAIKKSQTHWVIFSGRDCEWEGYATPEKKKISSAITECRIEQALKRIKFLENRVKELNSLIQSTNRKEQ